MLSYLYDHIPKNFSKVLFIDNLYELSILIMHSLWFKHCTLYLAVHNTETIVNNINLTWNYIVSTDNTCNVMEKYDHSILSPIDPDMNYPQLNDSFSTSNYYDENSFKYSFFNNNNLSLFHMNIRSIPKHFSDLKVYLTSLKHSFSVVRISETWLQDEVSSYPLVNYVLN